MAISIDTVYQRVLALANKEQRGYVTPQEFNLFANQAQMEIFEQYFYDINQWSRQHGNSTGHSDMLTNLEEKVSIFEKHNQQAPVEGDFGDVRLSEIQNLYRLTAVYVAYEYTDWSVAEEIPLNEVREYEGSPLTKWTKKRPIYTRSHDDNYWRINIYPYPPDGNDVVYIDYIKKPTSPNWGYVVVNDKALYNSTTSQDFELHLSEESELVYRILAFAGIAIEKPQLTQMAAGFEQAKVQQEKQ